MSLIGVASLVADMNVGPLTLSRSAAGAPNEFGERAAGAVSTITLDPVAVHTVSGAELLQVPEADRTREVIRIYATEALIGGTDRLAYRGASFRLVAASDYAIQGGVWMALAVREDPA